MQIKVVRFIRSPSCTIGELLIDGEHECYTLEDTVREPGVKVYGETAIPYGTYDVIVNLSNRFKRELPLLLNVPGFTGIRIHPGNVAADTHGCLLPGRGHTSSSVTESVKAFDPLFAKIRDAIKRGERVTITYVAGEQQ